MAVIQKRQPAKKFWIADLLNAEMKTNEQGFRHFIVREKEAIRVNLVAGVISSYVNEQGNYAVATIDDSSSQIKLKAWNEDVRLLAQLQIGEIVLVVGRINVNEMNSEIFVRPEIIKPVSIDWMELRRKELQKEFGQPLQPVRTVTAETAKTEETPKEAVFEEQVVGVPLSVREKMIQAIDSCDSVSGAEIPMAIKSSGLSEAEARAAISELIREGEAFQPKQGFIKLLS